MEHRKVVLGFALPADQQSTKAIVPAVRALNDPTARLATHAAEESVFATSANVRHDAAMAHGGFSVGVVVALVETEIARPAWTSRPTQSERIERGGDQPLVVNVGCRDDRR